MKVLKLVRGFVFSLFIFLILITFVFSVPRAIIRKINKNISSNKKNLQILKGDIKTKKKVINEIKKKEEVLNGKIKKLDSGLVVTKNKLHKVNKKFNYTKNKYNKNKKELEQTLEDLEDSKNAFKTEIKQIYKEKLYRVKYLDFLANEFFSSKSFIGIKKRYYFYKRLVEHRAKLFNQILKHEQDLMLTSEKIEKDIKNISYSKNKFNREKTRLIKNKNKEKRLLNKNRSKREEYERELRELEESAMALKNLINRIVRKKELVVKTREDYRQEFLTLVKTQGRSDWPIKGQVITKYGKQKHPNLDTTFSSNGIEIKANNGDIVYCVKDGKVIFADVFGSYGKMVIVSHEGGLYTVYAYLSDILVRKEVDIKKSTTIGYVGFSNFKKTYALYFEVRLDGYTVDPLLWLK